MPPTRLIHAPFYRPRPRVYAEACPVCRVPAGKKCVSLEDGRERKAHLVTYKPKAT